MILEKSSIIKWYLRYFIILFYFILFYVFCLFRAAPMAYGGYHARGLIRATACQPMPEPRQCQIQAMSSTYTTAHDNVGSLTHWASPGIEPETSWFLVRFVSAAPWWELQIYFICEFYLILVMKKNIRTFRVLGFTN